LHQQDIMRTLLTCLSFLFLTSSFGQEIELQGKYGASFIGGETIEFVGRDSFYFNGFYCTYGVHGKGRCEIRNNYLYLHFEKSKAEVKKDLVESPETTKIETVDSVAIVNITCVDNNNKPVSFATVQLKRKNKTAIGTISDSLGHTAFTITKNDMPLTIETSAVGFEPKHVVLEDYSSYNIKVFHKDVLIDKELNNGEVFVYEIDELSEVLISMRPENSRERFRKYRKG
jgi:hypothetical protein